MEGQERRAFVQVGGSMIPALAQSLSAGGFRLTIIEDAEESINVLAAREYNLIVTELHKNRDYVHRFDLMRSISDAPILALVDAADFSEVEPYTKLVDDILLTRFDPKELSMRAKALVNNITVSWKNGGAKSARFVYGNLRISVPKFKVVYKHEDIGATKTEFLILQLLAERPGQVFTREQIYDAVWHEFADSDISKSVNNHVQRLNNKLKKASGHEYIKAKWGIGYYFSLPQSVIQKIG